MKCTGGHWACGLYLLLASDDVGGADRLRVFSERHVQPEDELGVLRDAVGLAHEEVDERVGEHLRPRLALRRTKHHPQSCQYSHSPVSDRQSLWAFFIEVAISKAWHALHPAEEKLLNEAENKNTVKYLAHLFLNYCSQELFCSQS